MKRPSYCVRLKNGLTWVSMLLMAGFGASGILLREKAQVSGLWFGIVLPIAAAVWYIVVVIFGRHEQLYKIALPVSLALVILTERLFSAGKNYPLCYALLYLLVAAMFSLTISGKIKSRRYCIPMLLVPLAVTIVELRLTDGTVYAAIPPACVYLAMFFLILATRRHPDDGKYHPTWGDRIDGRRIRGLSPMYYIIPYIMKNRVGSMNLVEDSFESSKADAYIRQKRKEGYSGFGITTIMIAAYIRTLSQYPAANRFINGQKIYARNDIQVSMAMKKEMSTSGEETVIKMHFKPTDTVFDVHEKFMAAVEEVKNTPLNSTFDQTARFLNYIPGVLLRFTVGFLNFLDYFGLLPKFLLEVSPFHGSFFITSMGSLGIPPIYHHLYDFGNIPTFCAFGVKRHVNEAENDGTVTKKQYVDFTFATDERICDGFYYATTLKYMKRLLAHPERLEAAPEKVVEDVY